MEPPAPSTRVAAKAVKRLEFAAGENAAGALGKIGPAGLLLREQLGSSSSAIRPVKPDEADLESVAGHVTPQYPLGPITLEKGKVDAIVSVYRSTLTCNPVASRQMSPAVS